MLIQALPFPHAFLGSSIFFIFHYLNFYLCRCLSFFFKQLFFLLAFLQMTFQKKQMEKEAEEQKQKLLRSEQSLQASQNKEQDLRKKMEVKIQKQNYC